MVLLEAWIELRKTLAERQLRAPLRGVYRAISDIGAAQRLSCWILRRRSCAPSRLDLPAA